LRFIPWGSLVMILLLTMQLVMLSPLNSPIRPGNRIRLVISSTIPMIMVGGLQQVNWEVNAALNETCYIDSSRSIPCSQGNLPVYGVTVESPSDISATILFATSHNLRLTIKNTG